MPDRHLRVKLFATGTCPFCSVAKHYFAENRIEYTEVDISLDREARREMIVMTGQRGVPVVLIGEKTMVGWSEREFEKLYRR